LLRIWVQAGPDIVKRIQELLFGMVDFRLIVKRRIQELLFGMVDFRLG